MTEGIYSLGQTCYTCRVAFTASDVQRDHYQSEWHCYNLKRKVADLPPISLEQFKLKQKLFQDSNTCGNGSEPESFFCSSCSKNFQSQNTFNHHISSKKHREIEARICANEKSEKAQKLPDTLSRSIQSAEKKDEPHIGNSSDGKMSYENTSNENESCYSGSEIDDEEYDETQAIPGNSCLYCCHISSDIESNLLHMGGCHGFFLPDAQYCIDVEGMLGYLGQKVGCGHYCLFCSSEKKRFASLDACQKHMRDKGHCRVVREGLAMLEYEEFYDYSPLYPGGEDDLNSQFRLADDGYSLLLPSGARVGHRMLMRYYKQHFRSVQNDDGRIKQKKQLNKKIFGAYKKLGWTGSADGSAAQIAKDISFMKRLKAKNDLHIGLANNKIWKKFSKRIQ